MSHRLLCICGASTALCACAGPQPMTSIPKVQPSTPQATPVAPPQATPSDRSPPAARHEEKQDSLGPDEVAEAKGGFIADCARRGRSEPWCACVVDVYDRIIGIASTKGVGNAKHGSDARAPELNEKVRVECAELQSDTQARAAYMQSCTRQDPALWQRYCECTYPIDRWSPDSGLSPADSHLGIGLYQGRPAVAQCKGRLSPAAVSKRQRAFVRACLRETQKTRQQCECRWKNQAIAYTAAGVWDGGWPCPEEADE